MEHDMNDFDDLSIGEELKDRIKNGEITIRAAYLEGAKSIASGEEEAVRLLAQSMAKQRQKRKF